MAGGEPREPAPDASHDAPRGSFIVLVVDDEPLVRQWIARALTRVGIHVVSRPMGERPFA